jgi:small-conductance mechanosensitive channel
MAILFGSVLGGVALAFGLGARDTVSNMLAVQQVRRTYQAGDAIKLREVQGTITEITQAAVHVRTQEGVTMIPGRTFASEISSKLGPDA